MEIRDLTLQLAEYCQPLHAELADWLAGLAQADEAALWRGLNSNRVWVGADCVANQSLADNPGMEAGRWQMHVQLLRALLLDLAECLRQRGGANPAISQWIQAFHNWNAAGY